MTKPRATLCKVETVCAYCRSRRAVNRDHVVPKMLQKRLRRQGIDLGELFDTVPSCFDCNILKATRKLVPPGWAHKIPALKAAIPGKWRVWDGDPKSQSFTAVHK